MKQKFTAEDFRRSIEQYENAESLDGAITLAALRIAERVAGDDLADEINRWDGGSGLSEAEVMDLADYLRSFLIKDNSAPKGPTKPKPGRRA